jgi:hypothetical protein
MLLIQAQVPVPLSGIRLFKGGCGYDDGATSESLIADMELDGRYRDDVMSGWRPLGNVILDDAELCGSGAVMSPACLCGTI